MRAFPRDSDCKKVRHIGIETEIDVIGTCPKASDLDEEGLQRYRAGQGVEFRTIPISVRSLHGVRGTKRVQEHFDLIKSFTRVAQWGGTHLHISILDKDHPNLEANVISLTAAFFKEFQKVAGRRTEWAKRPEVKSLNDAKALVAIMNIFGHRERRYSRRYLMITPSRYQTLEFRGPVGSNDSEEILAWADFLEKVIEVSNCDSVHGVQFKDLLVGDRISKYVSELIGWRVFTNRELNKKLNESKL